MKPTPRPLFRALAPELVCAGALVAGLSLPARAQCGLSEFVASTTDGNDQFGAALSRDGDRLAVGAPRADESEFSAQFEGQVTVFERQGGVWVETATIDNPLAIPIDDFGRAVALNGDLLAIGAPAADSSEFVTDDGNVFLFELVGGSWTEIQRISLPAPTGVDRFGESLAWLGDELLIGAPGNDFIGADSGVVFAYRDTGAGFQPSGVLFAPESAGGERYGTSLAASGDRVAFGGPLANGASPFAGAVEVQTFDGSSFTHALNLPSPNVGAGSFFGESVALAGDLLVVGAPGSNAAVGSAAGSAWVFDLSQPAPTATALVPVDAQPSEAFGTAVAVDGTTAVVGRPRRSIGSTALVGAVDLFEQDGGGVWVQTARLEAPTDAILPGFGEVLELDQGELLVGAPEFSLGTTFFNEFQRGNVYALELATALEALTGCPPELSVVEGGAFDLRSRGAQPASPVLFLASLSGSLPGTPVGTTTIPINVDALTVLALEGGYPISEVLGTSDALGELSSTVTLAPFSPAGLAGATLTHATVTLDPLTLGVSSSAGPAALTLLP